LWLQIVSRGSDQTEISSRFESRNDPAVIRNYGTLLLEMCRSVPDGVVGFFVSYECLEKYVEEWDKQVAVRCLFLSSSSIKQRTIDMIRAHKLIFVETQVLYYLEYIDHSTNSCKGCTRNSDGFARVSTCMDACGLYLSYPFRLVTAGVVR
jgi:hypothetical protein